MKKNFKTDIYFVTITMFLILIGGINVNAYIAYNNAFYCGNSTMSAGEICSDCTNALNNNSYFKVYLNASVLNYTGTCIDNPENFTNKIFDCRGHTIDGDDSGSGHGIYLNGKNWDTIRNCTVTDFSIGVYLISSINNNLINNTANSNGNHGIYLDSSINNILIDNTANSNGNYGILLYSFSTGCKGM